MSIPPTIIPAKRRVRRKRRNIAPPTPAVLTVVSVVLVDEYHANWEFSGEVTTDGSGPTQLTVETQSGTQTPDACSQLTPTSVQCEYPNGTLDVGQPWNLSGQPDGFDLHGATMLVPQTGLVAT